MLLTCVGVRQPCRDLGSMCAGAHVCSEDHALKLSGSAHAGPVVPWRPGRSDHADGSKIVPDGRLPDATQVGRPGGLALPCACALYCHAWGVRPRP